MPSFEKKRAVPYRRRAPPIAESTGNPAKGDKKFLAGQQRPRAARAAGPGREKHL